MLDNRDTLDQTEKHPPLLHRLHHTLRHTALCSIIFIMLFALFILCSALTPALCCDWLYHQFSHVNNQSLTLLQLMGGQLTEEESPVPFPYRVYSRMRNTQVEESQLVFIRDSLQLISDLYRHGNLSSVTWDTNKTEPLLMNMHRQTEELNNCLSTEKRVDIRLRKYYKRLTKSTLDCTGGSTASWELIRMETKRHLAQLQMLVNSITSRRRSAASPQ